MDYRLEVVVIPVSDVDRAKAFYQGLGWRLDAGGVFHHAGTTGRVAGPAPEHQTYGSWVSFADPDWPAWYARYMADEAAGEGAGK